jgi:hypothetical protein
MAAQPQFNHFQPRIRGCHGVLSEALVNVPHLGGGVLYMPKEEGGLPWLALSGQVRGGTCNQRASTRGGPWTIK